MIDIVVVYSGVYIRLLSRDMRNTVSVSKPLLVSVENLNSYLWALCIHMTHLS